MMTPEATLRERFTGVQRKALIVGVIALAASAYGFVTARDEFYRSWLLGFLFCLGVPLGSLGFTMVHQLTSGAWGIAVRRLFQAATRTLPLNLMFFAPLALGLHSLYEWSHPGVVENDPMLRGKAIWLNDQGWYLRAGIYFAIWIGLAFALNRLAERFDHNRNAHTAWQMRAIAAPGIILYVVSMSAAAVDWAMSLEPHWFSTMYGVLFVVSQALSTLAFSIVISSWIARREPFSRWMLPDHYHDLGKLMFACVLLWAYTNFSQYLIIWAGNLPEETSWYLHRNYASWHTLSISLAIAHFFLPFLLLLSRPLKRNPLRLRWVALWLLGAVYLNLLWLIVPAFHRDGFYFHWLYFVTPIGMGGLWLAFFLQQLKGRPLVSLEDAHLEARLEGAPGHAAH